MKKKPHEIYPYNLYAYSLQITTPLVGKCRVVDFVYFVSFFGVLFCMTRQFYVFRFDG